jgi:hypothetical protein
MNPSAIPGGDVQAKLLLVQPSISMVGTTRADDTITEEVHKQHAAADEAGRYVANLWPEEHLKPIKKIASAARAYHRDHTVLSSFGSMLPSIMFGDYESRMKKFEAEFMAAAQDFIDNYEAIIEKARQIHNGKFRIEWYPSALALPEKFQFRLLVSPVPRAADIVVNYLAEERISQLQSEITARVNAAAAAAKQEAVSRVLEKVAHIADTLGKDKPRIFDSLIGNLAEVVDLAEAFNVESDHTVAALVNQCRADLARVDPDALRNSGVARKLVKSAAETVLAQFGNLGSSRKLAA